MRGLIVFLFSGENFSDKKLKKLFEKDKRKFGFKNKKGDYILSLDEKRWVIFYSLGKKKNLNVFALREAILKIRKIALTLKIKELKVYERNLRDLSFDYKFETLYYSALLNYSYQRKKNNDGAETVNFIFSKKPEGLDYYVSTVNFVRDLVNGGADEVNPEYLEKIAKRDFNGFKVKIIKGKELEEKGFGGIIAVGKGGGYDPRLIKIEYSPKSYKKTVALVGKAVTFDSGGLNVKPYSAMEDMKIDMSGGAIVLGVLKLAKYLKLPVQIKGYIPAVENMPGPKAYKQGDIVKIYNGKTVEIRHTDAEGRLILADALSLADEEGADLIVDFATLTGACISALGTKIAAILGTDKKSLKKMFEISWKIQEPLWELPLPDFYEKDVKSEIADIKNTGYGIGGGTIKAALFLKEFIGKRKWLHLDVAGPVYFEKGDFFGLKGATGFGVRLTIEFLKHLS